ncbi:DNA-binding protein [Streptomyces sp. NPDC023327]|uniref:DNA-binding protein n=1 Tax=Streptomyces sp. NPDC023327 TaxID=3157088 RepID=UPI0033FF0D81
MVGRGGDQEASSVPTVMRACRHLLALDAEHGPRAAVPALRTAVRGVPELSVEPERLRHLDGELLAALAELSEVIGWILFDAGQHRRAQRANGRALALAELCGDRWTARLVLLNHAMLQTRVGRPRAALATTARVPGPRPLPARVAALVLIRRAHAVALLGGDRAAARLVSRAGSRFLDGACRHDPPWAWWFDETELLGHQGWVLARLRRWDRALPLLHRAATAPGGPSYRDLFGAELLAALAAAGDWREAETLVADLVPRVAGVASARTAESLTATATRLKTCATAPASLRDGAAHLLALLGTGK